MIKFPIEYRVGEVWGDQVAVRKCYIAMLEMDDRLQIMCIEKPTDVFTWSHEVMPGIDLSVIVHKLNVLPSSPPIRQKKSVFA